MHLTLSILMLCTRLYAVWPQGNTYNFWPETFGLDQNSFTNPNSTFPVGFLNKQIPLNTMNSASDNSDFLTTASLHLAKMTFSNCRPTSCCGGVTRSLTTFLNTFTALNGVFFLKYTCIYKGKSPHWTFVFSRGNKWHVSLRLKKHLYSL